MLEESLISKTRKEKIGVIIQKEKIEINELDALMTCSPKIEPFKLLVSL